MKRSFLHLFYSGLSIVCLAQRGSDTGWKKLYRESPPIVNDLVHTKLKVRFDFDKAYLYGEVWITLKPHFYPTDTLNLDAKQMDIATVAVLKENTVHALKYDYDGWHLKIKLDKSYKASEKYTIYVKYTAKPQEAKLPSDRRGLYFINPRKDQKDMPTQVWTDGETDHTSVWCPIIDQPNEKTTQEIIMTVPDKYVTLSNGKLISQEKNKDGTRTDHWKMDLPLAAYLFFMGVGDFTIVKDQYKGKEVNYYVENQFARTARGVFGLTPSMIAFFERITGVSFPWVKYSQIALRNFTSEAMENTTATAHADAAQQDARELIDGNRWEATIAHELFHQWFGDYVTCESWSNLTLNESFANYGQYLWKEYRYGADEAGEENYNGMDGYLHNREEGNRDLVRFYYADQEDMFDGVSYQKGGVILNMLRNYLGDSAFFKGLNLYLTTNKFRSAEAHQLRLSMEEVSGKDLNWFFDQWYFGSGHPKVIIDYAYNDTLKKIAVTITQTQGANHLFKIPLSIDIYHGAAMTRHQVCINREKEIFVFDSESIPDLVNVDGAKVILWEKTDHKKLNNFIHQYDYAGTYADRREAITACAKQQSDSLALNLLKKALKDRYYGLRLFVLGRLNMKSDTVRQSVEPTLLDLVRTDPKSTVRAKAIELLGTYQKPEYKSIFIANLNDSSYNVAGAALTALAKLDSGTALIEAKRQMQLQTKRALAEAVIDVLFNFGSEDQFDFVLAKYMELPFIIPNKIVSSIHFARYLAKVKNTQTLKKGVDAIVQFRDALPGMFGPRINPELSGLMQKKESEGLKDQADYIKSKIPG
jgi:aminopeptidase N